ncbi:MAG: hypothetical protein C0594_03405 [Marinilabiliales bacterium]|nr:MAG: hypothetical protein C0594_03405 [Marinilabiliales bacterium]
MIIIFWQSVSAQRIYQSGMPFVTNYSPKVYNGHPQNWAIKQDKNKLLYVANNQQIMEYDGVSWNFILTPFVSSIRSLELDDTGKIYLGSNNEFGYLHKDSIGNFSYTSLSNNIISEYPDFGEVRRILIQDQKVYFVAYNYVFCFENDKYSSWYTETNFRYGFKVNNNIYIREEGIGLNILKNKTLEPIEGTEILADKDIHFLLPFNDTCMLAGTRYHGLYTIGKSTVKFHTNADEYISAHNLYHGIRLQNGLFALATDFGGVLIIDESGRLIQLINKNTGLQNETINYVYEDRDNNLWIALNIGIASVSINNPLTHFGEESGLNGLVVALKNYKNKLYAGTMQGIFYLTEKETLNKNREPNYKFNKIPDFANSCLDLEIFQDDLYFTTTDGLYKLNGNKAEKITDVQIGHMIYPYKKDTNYMFVAAANGINLLKKDNQKLEFLGMLEGVDSETRRIVEDNYGRLWVGDQQKGLDLILFEDEPNTKPTIVQIDSTCGLPHFDEINQHFLDGRVFVDLGSGIYEYQVHGKDTNDIHFVKTDKYPLRYPESNNLISYSDLSKISDKEIWVNGSIRVFKLEWSDSTGEYELWDNPFRRISRTSFFAFMTDTLTNKLWFGGSDGLYCYNMNYTLHEIKDQITLIRKVRIAKDSTIFQGAGQGNIGELFHPELKYKYNSLEVEFSLPFFENEEKNSYSYMLEGFDDTWSEWTDETKAVFTNIPAGEYTFKVEGKNIYGIIAKPAEFKIIILSPWYKTWWAYIIYTVSFVLFILLFSKLYASRLKNANLRLERIIDDRTREIIR